MAEGTVKWFDKKKGYGFIAHEGTVDVFVHYTGFADDTIRTLDDGDTVTFDIVQGEKGLRAANIMLKGPLPTTSATAAQQNRGT
jgi:CspA family cold shock protein